MGSWTVLDAVAIADCALEIHGGDLDDLFATAARALADVMVERDTVARDVERTLRLEARALDLLLHDFELVVHRKGATRAFGPGTPDVPAAYRAFGQPVIIGGSMETGSALLVGTAHAMTETFGSTAHGAGRTMSRAQAKRRVWGETLVREMRERGIVVRAASPAGVAEEAGFAYKDLGEVVDTVHRLDISRKVVSLRPIGNIKG